MFDIIGVFRLKEHHIYKKEIVPCSEKRWKGLRRKPTSTSVLITSVFPALKRDERDWDIWVTLRFISPRACSLLWKEMKGIETNFWRVTPPSSIIVPCSEKRWKGLRQNSNCAKVRWPYISCSLLWKEMKGIETYLQFVQSCRQILRSLLWKEMKGIETNSWEPVTCLSHGDSSLLWKEMKGIETWDVPPLPL